MKLLVLSQDYQGNAFILTTKTKLKETLIPNSQQFERIKSADLC